MAVICIYVPNKRCAKPLLTTCRPMPSQSPSSGCSPSQLPTVLQVAFFFFCMMSYGMDTPFSLDPHFARSQLLVPLTGRAVQKAEKLQCPWLHATLLGNEKKHQCVINVVFLLKPKLGILPKKEKSTLSQLNQDSGRIPEEERWEGMTLTGCCFVSTLFQRQLPLTALGALLNRVPEGLIAWTGTLCSLCRSYLYASSQKDRSARHLLRTLEKEKHLDRLNLHFAQTRGKYIVPCGKSRLVHCLQIASDAWQ